MLNNELSELTGVPSLPEYRSSGPPAPITNARLQKHFAPVDVKTVSSRSPLTVPDFW
jgi:hypothetical protein